MKITKIMLLVVMLLWACAIGVAHAAEPVAQLRTPPGLSTAEDVLQFLLRQRTDAALLSYSVLPDGRIDPGDPILAQNAEQPFPLASTRKLIHLAAFALAIHEGRLNPSEQVSVADWERFYLPGSDGGAHPRSLAYLQIPFDEFGFARDRQATVTLSQLADVMMRFSDNAAPDWFLERLGAEQVNSVSARAQLRGQERVYFGLGEFLLAENHETGLLSPQRVRELLLMSRVQIEAEARRLVEAYQQEEWRTAEWLWRLENSEKLDEYRQSAFLANLISTKGTAADMARLMSGVLTGTFLAPEVSAVMRQYLEWPADFADVIPFFDVRGKLSTWGAKGGTLLGVQTQANYFVPRTGEFTGKGRIVVLLLRNLPERGFNQLLESAADIHLGLELGTNQALVRQVARALPRRIFL